MTTVNTSTRLMGSYPSEATIKALHREASLMRRTVVGELIAEGIVKSWRALALLPKAFIAGARAFRTELVTH